MSLRIVCLAACLLIPSAARAQSLFEDGLIQPTAPCFNDFISPMTNPVFFEDPRNVTEARFIFLNHDVPNRLGGKDVQLYALQLRASLTERLSFIATKDGYIVSDNPIVGDGWADVSAGLKYNVVQDCPGQKLLSVGFTYELPVGSGDALQGNGDGEFNLFATGGLEFLDNFHYVTASGLRLPADRSNNSQIWYWSNHVDYQIGDTGFYFLGETNWYHWMRSGDRFPVAVEGLDVINLGSRGVAGNDIVTGALGIKYKPMENMELGLAWEVPLTDRRDILQDRLTFDWIIRY